MASNGNKKHGRTKKSAAQIRYTSERRWEANKAARVAAEKAWQSACKAVRSLAGDVGKKVRDVSRRVRIMRRSGSQ